MMIQKTCIVHREDICLNIRCNNVLPENRVSRKNDKVSRWYFCVPCLRHERSIGSTPLTYKCRRADCMNTISFERITGSPPKSYCSILCYHRNMTKTKLPEERTCSHCNETFTSNLGYVQKYCSKECRERYHNAIKKGLGV